MTEPQPPLIKTDYARREEIAHWKERVLLCVTLVSLALTLNEKYKLSTPYPGLEDYIQVVIAINSFLVLLYGFLDFRENYIYNRAEKARLLRFIDNSFETNFGGKRIENYFTQDKLNPGLYKACVNCFENIYFSYRVASKMQTKVYLKAGFVVSVFILAATVGDRGFVRYLSEAILPLALFQSAVKLAFFVNRLGSLEETFATFFNSIKDASFEHKEPEAIKNIIAYETTLAWAVIPLDSKIFTEMNPRLSSEWESLKVDYNIKQEKS